MPVWFRQKKYGYGAYPTTWQGWVLTIVPGVALVALAIWLFGVGAWRHEAPLSSVLAFLIVGAGTVAAVVYFTHRTTEGGWRWRWGGDDARPQIESNGTKNDPA